MTDVQLDAAALHAAARDKDAPAPAEFAHANVEVESKRREYDHAVWARHDLIKAAREIGIPWTVLSKWTGLNRRSLDRIVHDR